MIAVAKPGTKAAFVARRHPREVGTDEAPDAEWVTADLATSREPGDHSKAVLASAPDLVPPPPVCTEAAGFSAAVDVPEPEGVSQAALGPAPDLSGYTELRVWSECFEDAQKARIACENRMLRGGIDPTMFVAQLDALKAAEHQIKLAMVRCYRRVVPDSIREWQRGTFGIGEHLLARLLGTLGHPRIATPYHWQGEGSDRVLVADPPFSRSLRQLWSYCGHGDATRKRKKGMSAEEAFALGNPRAKMIVHLLSEAAMKCRVEPISDSEATLTTADPTSSERARGNPESQITPGAPPPDPTRAITDSQRGLGGVTSNGTHVDNGSPSPVGAVAETPRAMSEAPRSAASRRLRSVYDQARAKYADREDWTDGHKHAAALRMVGKELLRGLWAVS